MKAGTQDFKQAPNRNAEDEDLSGRECNQLWAAVILQAIADAERPIRQRQSEAEKRNAARLKQEARDWLLDNSPDFREVCYLAGIDPEETLKSLRKRLEGQGTPPTTH